ncbi:MAG: ABC transporter permease subunit [Acidimicrobiales bacterium]
MALTLPIWGLNVPLEVAVLGLITGLTYGLLAVGLVLAYKSARVINFAHGEMGALSAGVIPVLVISKGWPYWAALVAALGIAASTGALVEFGIIRRFARAPRLIVLVATIGAAQLFFAVGAFIPKGTKLGAATFPTPFTASISIGTLRLNSGELLILIVAPLAAALLALFVRRSKVGMAVRAAAENSDAAQLAGVPVRRISLVMWSLTGLLAGVSAILVGPTRPIVTQVALGPQLLVRGLAAAMIAGLVSMPRAFAAGVSIGLIEAVVEWNYPTGGTVEVVLFAVILISLLARKGMGTNARGGDVSSWSLSGKLAELHPRLANRIDVRILRGAVVGVAIVVGVLVALPASNAHRVLMSSVLLFACMGLSLVVLTGFAGQVSLGQFAFVGLGALVGGRMHQLGYPPGMALLYAVIGGGVVALVIGLPALRIRGLFLAVITLAFAVAAQTWLYGQRWLVHVAGGQTSLEIPRPRILGIDFQSELHYYWLCLGALVVLSAIVHRIRVSGVGRAMMAVRDNEPAAASMGVAPRRVKLGAFVLAGMIAACAGYLYGGLLVNFSQPDTFAAELSLALLGMVILGGVTTVTGAIVGAIFLKGLTYVVAPLLPGLLGSSVAFLLGGFGLLAALYQFPAGVVEPMFSLRDRLLERILGSRSEPETDPVPRRHLVPIREPTTSGEDVGRDGSGTDRGVSAASSHPGASLEAAGIVVRFGGKVVVEDVSLHALPGEIVGLVGPNGAGKTTFFDVLSGHLRPAAGRVLLHGADVTQLRPEQRARLGLGRTFQQARLFNDMMLLDAIKVALERDEPTELVPSLLGLGPSRHAERGKQLRAEDLVELLGLRRFTHLHVGELSTGTRRMAELGCMVALGASVVLLDEPTAGIAQREVEAFRPVLREIREHLGATMVVVEHDIPLMMGLVDRLYVLNVGKLLAEGPPQLLRNNEAVVAAYLGTDERVINRSGALAAASSARADR